MYREGKHAQHSFARNAPPSSRGESLILIGLQIFCVPACHPQCILTAVLPFAEWRKHGDILLDKNVGVHSDVH